MASMPHLLDSTPLRWDLFCRVVDNFGDVGVCWRLASELGARGHRVRLVIDDARALSWIAPDGARGVSVVDWRAVESRDVESCEGDERWCADVVIEAFGCALPPVAIARLFASAPPPVWLNLEYLSAEPFAEQAHGLPSPQFDGAGNRIEKWFFYPGFSERSGGLIREAGLMKDRAAFARKPWFAAKGTAPAEGERVVSLFCYDNPALDAMLALLGADAGPPTLLLTAVGVATDQVGRLLGSSMRRGTLRAMALPLLSQLDYDHLLWSCDLNFVRGEDSFVRAQWAGVPFVWQAYPQQDGAAAAKVDAFLAVSGAAGDVRSLFECWNGMGGAAVAWPAWPAWCAATTRWQRTLAAQRDLVTRLVGFVAGKR